MKKFILESWKEREEKLQEKIDHENKELRDLLISAHLVGLLGLLALAGYTYCSRTTDYQELKKQYHNCTYYLERIKSEEVRYFVTD